MSHICWQHTVPRVPNRTTANAKRIILGWWLDKEELESEDVQGLHVGHLI